MTVEKNVSRRSRSFRYAIVSGAIFAAASLFCAQAYAVSEKVKNACRDDYFQHCSQYAVDTDELRQCMRKVGENLSTPCLVALVEDGQITKEDVERHNAAKATGTKKNQEQIASKDAGDPKDVSAKAGKKTKTAKKKKPTPASTAVAEAAGSTTAKADPAKGDDTDKSVKVAEADQTGAKVKTGKTGKKSGKKKSKKSKATGATAAESAPAKAAAPDAAVADPKTKKSGTAKAKAGTKKKSAGTAVKTKKTSKKKSTATKPKKALDGQTP